MAPATGSSSTTAQGAGEQLATSLDGQRILAQGRGWIGTEYLSGGATRSGVDCSHFVWKVYGEAGLPYSYASTGSFVASLVVAPGKPPKPGQKFRRVTVPQDGDVVLYSGHMGLYVSADRTVLSARSSSAGVSYGQSSWFGSVLGYYRYIK